MSAGLVGFSTPLASGSHFEPCCSFYYANSMPILCLKWTGWISLRSGLLIRCLLLRMPVSLSIVHTNFKSISNVFFRHALHKINNCCYLLWIQLTLNDVCGETKTRQGYIGPESVKSHKLRITPSSTVGLQTECSPHG